MQFKDIKPFVRFANSFEYKPEGLEAVALDCRLIFVRDGHGELLLDGKRREITAGTLVYARCGVPYGFFAENTLKVIAVNFDMDMSRTNITSTMSKIAKDEYKEVSTVPYIDDAESLNDSFILEKATQYERTLGRIAEEFRCRKPYYSEKISAMLEYLLADLLRENLSSKKSEITDVIEYVNVNFRQRVTNEVLASMAGYHPLHLNRLFKREIGTTVHNYVLRLRIAEAERLLISTDMAISDIADAVGFENATHFSTQFKKTESLSPLEYRKKFRGVV